MRIKNYTEYHNYRDAAQYWAEEGDETLALGAAEEAVRAAGLDPRSLNNRELHSLAHSSYMLPLDPNLLRTVIHREFDKLLAFI